MDRSENFITPAGANVNNKWNFPRNIYMDTYYLYTLIIYHFSHVHVNIKWEGGLSSRGHPREIWSSAIFSPGTHRISRSNARSFLRFEIFLIISRAGAE